MIRVNLRAFETSSGATPMSIAMDPVYATTATRITQNPFSWSTLGGAAAAASKCSPIDEDLRALQQIGAKVRFTRGETIFNDGDEATHCYKVISGAVRLCKHMADGRRQIADFLLAGDLFGFMQFGQYKFSAEAIGDVVLMCYPQRHVARLSSSMPNLRGRVLVLLSQRLLGMQDHLVMLGRQTAKERIASFLLHIAERSDAEEDLAFDLPMSRQDIADYLGLTIETVCRMLSELKREKVIAIPNVGQIIVKDIASLQTLTEGGE
jgi:CRP/FNR family nitrogen fixation transcriptional regulator